MIKTLTNLLKQDKEKFVVPKGVQDCIPITAIYDDGIFRVGKDKYSKSFKFTDINFAVASREDKEAMFLEYSELLNSLDSGATTKLTINNRRLNRLDFEKTILIHETGDELDVYREEYNKMLLDKATGANAIVQDKYVTISINKKSVEDARTYFARVGADLIAHFARLGSKCVELETDERLRIVHDFFRVGEETAYHFNIKETRKKGHDFKDYVCPDTMEFEKDYFKMGNRYGRVLFLREYASYIKDSMVAELTDLNRNLMMSIDIVPVPTDEAVREAESRLLGVETNITNWQRKQNQNNNFSATVPYDMEQQKKEMKEFLDDLNAELLLWVPPSKPYYAPQGVFKNVPAFSKTLIFSSWEMVPRMIAGLLSYEAERKTVGKLAKSNEAKEAHYFYTIASSMDVRTTIYTIDTFNAFKARANGTKEKPTAIRSHFAVAFTKGDGKEKDADRKKSVRNSFNSPFRPFVLASTSIGQEGLDFHNYCRRIVHWNLPSNPIDLEQREGRINRFECLAIRQNISKRYGDIKFKENVWKEMFDVAAKEENGGKGSDLIPFWGLTKRDDMVKIERIVPMYPFSRDELAYERLIKILSLYRLTLGQARQEELLEYIFQNCADVDEMKKLFINLSPYYKNADKEGQGERND